MRGRGLPVLALAAAASFVAAALVSVPAEAAPRGGAAPDSRAVVLFEESVRAYREGRFQDAVDLLVEARKHKAEPVLLYNLGRAYEALGQQGEAAAAYERYLAEEPKAADRGAIEGRIATLRAQESQLAAARREDDGARGSPGGERAKVEDRTGGGGLGVVPWILVGAGAVGIGSGLFLGLMAEGRHDDAVADPVQRSAAEHQQAAESLATAANVTLLAGAVVATVGLAWLGIRAAQPSRISRGGASLPLGTTGVGVSF
jgi:tetratricopeptide (TPR) repeat protein